MVFYLQHECIKHGRGANDTSVSVTSLSKLYRLAGLCMWCMAHAYTTAVQYLL